MAGKIFINYRREDSAPHALNVAQYLEKTFGKTTIFIDIDRLRAGQKFAAVLEEKLSQCKVTLAIIGPNWVDVRDQKTGTRRLDNPEDWVRLEIERALARKIPVIPILVAGATLPAKGDLPPSLQPLIEHQYAKLTTTGFRHEMAGLAHDVDGLIGRRPWAKIAVGVAFAIFFRRIFHGLPDGNSDLGSMDADDSPDRPNKGGKGQSRPRCHARPECCCSREGSGRDGTSAHRSWARSRRSTHDVSRYPTLECRKNQTSHNVRPSKY
jgi:hypothetical protein